MFTWLRNLVFVYHIKSNESDDFQVAFFKSAIIDASAKSQALEKVTYL